jgi:hypothetical protein
MDCIDIVDYRFDIVEAIPSNIIFIAGIQIISK